MIVLVVSRRMSGKSTFAINEILLKRKEHFVIFSQNNELCNLYKGKLIKNGFPSFVDKIYYQKKNILRGRDDLKYIVCDDYEQFNEDFRKDLFLYYTTGRVKFLLLLCSNEQNVNHNFVDTINKVRDLTLNDYSSVERTNKVLAMSSKQRTFIEDVISLQNISIVNNINSPKDFNKLDYVFKQLTVKERFEQVI
jgi:hypothetical protein